MAVTRTLAVHPIRCAAHGLCAELLPERIALDDWGYPILTERVVSPELVDAARRAAAACPTLALTFAAADDRRSADQR